MTEKADYGGRCRLCVSGHTGPQHDAERALNALSPEQQAQLRAGGASTRKGEEPSVAMTEVGSSLSPQTAATGGCVHPLRPSSAVGEVGEFLVESLRQGYGTDNVDWYEDDDSTIGVVTLNGQFVEIHLHECLSAGITRQALTGATVREG